MADEPKACFELKIRCGGNTLRIIEGYASAPLFYVNGQDIKIDTEEKFSALCQCLCTIDKIGEDKSAIIVLNAKGKKNKEKKK